MAALLHFNPAQIPVKSGLKVVAAKTNSEKMLSDAEFRKDTMMLVLLPLVIAACGVLLSHGWTAILSAACGVLFLGFTLLKAREEWKVLHHGIDAGVSLRGKHIVVGKVDAIHNRKNGRFCSCNVARYHFLTRTGDFRSGMYLSSAKLPEAGEPILIAYDAADPKRIQVIDHFVFYRFPTAG